MSKVERRFMVEPERYEFSAAPMHQFELARRDFFKILGAGIAVFAIAKDATAAQETAPGHRSFHNEEWPKDINARSEEHTSELQSQSNLVCRLLLEKKKKNKRGRDSTETTVINPL